LLLRTLSDLKSRRKPEIKRRLENKIKNLKLERHTMKEEKNNFVTDCNELSSVFEDKNKLEHKLSQFRRKMKKTLASPDDQSESAMQSLISHAKSLIKEHDNMEQVLERHVKKRNIATLEISKYLVEVACLLDAEVKLRNFEDLLDSWREKYNIEEESQMDEEPSGAYYSDYNYYDSYDYPYYSDYYYDDDYAYYSDYYYSDENGDHPREGADGENDHSYSYSYSYTPSGDAEGDTKEKKSEKRSDREKTSDRKEKASDRKEKASDRAVAKKDEAKKDDAASKSDSQSGSGSYSYSYSDTGSGDKSKSSDYSYSYSSTGSGDKSKSGSKSDSKSSSKSKDDDKSGSSKSYSYSDSGSGSGTGTSSSK